MTPKQFYKPLKPEVADRKERFAALNAYITKAGGWLTSIPGDPEMWFEALPDSGLPAALQSMGYIVERTGETQRILPSAITERFEISSSGALVTAVEGSTQAVTTRVTHAGLATVIQYDLRLP
jgi:hypothetical protein